MEEKINLLKILIQESKYPLFSDAELSTMLNHYEGNVYTTAYHLCLMKANSESEITVGPITIKMPSSEYWVALASDYKTQSLSEGSESTSGGYYKTRMRRE